MNSKILLAALAGGAVACGITYFLMVPRTASIPVRTQAQPSPVATQAPPEVVATEVKPAPASEPPKLELKRSPFVQRPQPEPAPAPVEEPKIETPPMPPPPAISQTPLLIPTPPTPPKERVALFPPKELDQAQVPIVRAASLPGGANSVTIPAGTVLNVRLGETLSTNRNLTGDTFYATLDQPLVAGGFVIAEKGARVEGRIVEVDKAGHMTGASRISLELTQVNTSDGQRVQLQTSPYSKEGGERTKKSDAAKVGGGAALGAIIGAAAGGGKGAGVGAGVGGAAGAGAVLLSGGRNVTIPVETRLAFNIQAPVTITERVMQ
jgi:hypothetical protein